MEILQPLSIVLNKRAEVSPHSKYSAYFPYGYKYKYKDRNEDGDEDRDKDRDKEENVYKKQIKRQIKRQILHGIPVEKIPSDGVDADQIALTDFLSRYKTQIARFHMPPECNFRNFENLVDFLRFLYVNLTLSCYRNTIGIDAHAGHGSIRLDEIIEKSTRLNNYLANRNDPRLYISVENVHGSGLSSKQDMLSFASDVHRNGLGRIRLTVDVTDLQKAENSTSQVKPFVDLVREMKSRETLDVLSGVHDSEDFRGIIEREVGSSADVHLVLESPQLASRMRP